MTEKIDREIVRRELLVAEKTVKKTTQKIIASTSYESLKNYSPKNRRRSKNRGRGLSFTSSQELIFTGSHATLSMSCKSKSSAVSKSSIKTHFSSFLLNQLALQMIDDDRLAKYASDCGICLACRKIQLEKKFIALGIYPVNWTATDTRPVNRSQSRFSNKMNDSEKSNILARNSLGKFLDADEEDDDDDGSSSNNDEDAGDDDDGEDEDGDGSGGGDDDGDDDGDDGGDDDGDDDGDGDDNDIDDAEMDEELDSDALDDDNNNNNLNAGGADNEVDEEDMDEGNNNKGNDDSLTDIKYKNRNSSDTSNLDSDDTFGDEALELILENFVLDSQSVGGGGASISSVVSIFESDN